jgi:hypothetical protein
MSSDLATFRLLHAQLVLSTPAESLILPENPNDEESLIIEFVKFISSGEAYKVLQNSEVSELLLNDRYLREIQNAGVSFNDGLSTYTESLTANANKELLLIVGIASLQMFIQNNFTGPQVPVNSFDYFYSNSNFNKEQIQLNASKGLSSYGQSAYQDSDDPLFLLVSLHIFEKLSIVKTSLLSESTFSSEELVGDELQYQIDIADPFTAAVNWWRSRSIQVQQSLYPEASGPHVAVLASLLNTSLVKSLAFDASEKLQKDLSIVYHLEQAKSKLDSNMEHLALPSLINAQRLTNFEFVLTGGRAKRTKFQQVAHSGLIILAKSNYFNTDTIATSNQTPENFELNSDLLLERPIFENVGQEDVDEQIYKKQKTDFAEIDYTKILPVALRQEYIPDELKSLDPNNQPNLSDYDNIQLLLRLYTLRQISPANDSLAEQQLMSLVSRVLYQSDSANVNYSIFSRGLWERSILETTKARTIERGILQMQSLVEEIGLKIKARYIPTEAAGGNGKPASNTRLRYIFQLPLLPRWSLDTKLAEKYMSLGIVKSAIEIYERLNLDTEVALCHAAIGEEEVAQRIINDRLERFPDDARAMSIMGDLTQDPSYWEKAWEIGKYSKAKISLGKYYYSPPQGVVRDLVLAIKHIHEALVTNPVSFDNWFFYGCLGLETQQFELSAEAFTRCVSIDDTNSNSWSNLATSLLRMNKTKEAFNALKKATSTSDNTRSWRLWENYLIVASKLGDWDEVLHACKKLVDFRKDSNGEGSIDIPVVEKLVEILVSQDYDPDALSFFQRSCIEFTTITLPNVITTSSRLWRIISRVELWRKRPWASLECHEKAYRALTHNPDLPVDEKIWNEAIDACSDLVAAYESLGELPGKYGAGDLVCKDWKYKAKSTVKSLMSKGKSSWEDSEGWDRLVELRSSI